MVGTVLFIMLLIFISGVMEMRRVTKRIRKLQRIVKQLQFCNYECEAGPLELNTAFIELVELATMGE